MNIDRFLLVMRIMDVVEDSVNCECTSMGATNTAGLRTRWSCSTFPFFQERLFSGRLLLASTGRFRGRLRSFCADFQLKLVCGATSTIHCECELFSVFFFIFSPVHEHQ